MKRVCSWCQAQIGDDGRKDGMTTHGICLMCSQKENAKLDKIEKQKQILRDTFKAIKPEGRI